MIKGTKGARQMLSAKEWGETVRERRKEKITETRKILGQDQKGKNKVKETDGKGMGRDYKREERMKETGDSKKPTEWTRL